MGGKRDLLRDQLSRLSEDELDTHAHTRTHTHTPRFPAEELVTKETLDRGKRDLLRKNTHTLRSLLTPVLPQRTLPSALLL